MRTASLVNGQVASAVNALVEKHRGVEGIVNRLERQGLVKTVRSWVSSRANLSICADQVVQVFGAGTIRSLAATIGVAPQDLAQRLARALPATINQLTCTGVAQRSVDSSRAGCINLES